jgi:hypothetical protein
VKIINFFLKISVFLLALEMSIIPNSFVKSANENSNINKFSKENSKRINETNKSKKKRRLIPDILKLAALCGTTYLFVQVCKLLDRAITLFENPYETIVPEETQKIIKIISTMILYNNLNGLEDFSSEEKKNLEKIFRFVLEFFNELGECREVVRIIRKTLTGQTISQEEAEEIKNYSNVLKEILKKLNNKDPSETMTSLLFESLAILMRNNPK